MNIPKHSPFTQKSTCLFPCLCRDEVDEHGFQMQHVVNIHLGFLPEAPHTAQQARTSQGITCRLHSPVIVACFD